MKQQTLPIGTILEDNIFVLEKVSQTEGGYRAVLSNKGSAISAYISDERAQDINLSAWIGGAVKISGPVLDDEEGNPCVKVKKAVLAKKGEYKPHELYDGLSEEKIQLYQAIISDAINRVPNQGVKALITAVLNDALIANLSIYPASLAYQAKYRGGALAQTATVCRFILQIGVTLQKYGNGLYESDLEWSVLLAGALLHMAAIPDYFDEQPLRRSAIAIDRGYMSLLQSRIERANYSGKEAIIPPALLARILNALQVTQQKSVVTATSLEGVLLRQAVLSFVEIDQYMLAALSSTEETFYDTKTRRHINTVPVEVSEVAA